MSTVRTVRPRSAAIDRHGPTFASWSRVVTTTSSSGPSERTDRAADMEGQAGHVRAELDLVGGRGVEQIRQRQVTVGHDGHAPLARGERPAVVGVRGPVVVDRQRRSPVAAPASRRARRRTPAAARPARARGRGTRGAAQRRQGRSSASPVEAAIVARRSAAVRCPGGDGARSPGTAPPGSPSPRDGVSRAARTAPGRARAGPRRPVRGSGRPRDGPTPGRSRSPTARGLQR